MTGYIVGGSLCIVSFTLYTGKTSSLVLSLFEAPTWTRYLKFPSTAWQGQTCYQERARATSLNHEDPINPDFEATSEMYHRWRLAEELSIRKLNWRELTRCLLECMRRISLYKQAGAKKVWNSLTLRYVFQCTVQVKVFPRSDEYFMYFLNVEHVEHD